MSKSIISNERQCLVCGTTINLHKHHIFYGMANRKLSEKYGCWCYLCAKHHNMSDHGVHSNAELNLELKQMAQRAFEDKCGTREDFMQIFGRNWLD